MLAYIGLGSNLNNPKQQIKDALIALNSTQDVKVAALSSLYQSKPIDDSKQPDYINAVAQFDTDMDAHDLLSVLQQIEKDNGRKRNGQRWEARTLDLDLLLYGNIIIDTATLVVPHPWMYERSFVLYPLQELSPDLIFPDGKTLKQRILNVSASELWLIA